MSILNSKSEFHGWRLNSSFKVSFHDHSFKVSMNSPKRISKCAKKFPKNVAHFFYAVNILRTSFSVLWYRRYYLYYSLFNVTYETSAELVGRVIEKPWGGQANALPTSLHAGDARESASPATSSWHWQCCDNILLSLFFFQRAQLGCIKNKQTQKLWRSLVVTPSASLRVHLQAETAANAKKHESTRSRLRNILPQVVWDTIS